MSKRPKRKLYDKKESPFYRLSNRRKLGTLLGMEIGDIEALISKDNNYRIFLLEKGTENEREVQEPKDKLKYLHKRLFSFLQRINTPEFLHSGVSGKSYISNAEVHRGAKTLLTLDIRSFFKSTKSWHIYDFFNETMQCSSDVSGVLAKLCTYSGHIPTGSSLSQAIAFYANSKMLIEIESLVTSLGHRMTCYVDDITISGENVNGELLYRIRGILHQYGMSSHPNKEHLYLSSAPRKVTGSIVFGDTLLLPNTKHRDIFEETQVIIRMSDSSYKLTALDKLIGKAIAASRADSNFMPQLEKLKSERSRLRTVLSRIDPNDQTMYLYTDGGSRGNPGLGSIGIVIKSSQDKIVREFAEKVGRVTNNEAEYKALVRGLKISNELTNGRLICFSDSQVMVNQMNGNYRIKNRNLRKLSLIASNLTKNFESVEFRHVPRTNVGVRRADKLLNQARN